MKQIKIIMLFAVMLIATSAFAQGKFMVAGTVMDESGAPLIGVTVKCNDKRVSGVVTDLDGKFRVKDIPGNATLDFTYLGYKKYSYKVNYNKEGLKVVLKQDIGDLDEVVVVAAGTQKKVSMTGAITTVKPENLDVPATSITNMLGGNVPGIIAVTRSGEPGNDFSEFWIRGISTFGANSSALVLIDGIEGNLNDLDASDIESFSILKDASATAVYGVRGANGVIVVTTKSGKAGKLRINFKSNFIMSENGREPKYCDAYTYAKLANEAQVVRGNDPKYTPTELELFRTGLDPDLYPNVNWRDVILNKHVWQNQEFLSIAGGGTAARYYLSLSILSKDGVFKQDKSCHDYNTNVGYTKYSFLSKVDANLTKRTTLSLKLNQVIVDNDGPGLSDNNTLWSAQANLTPVTMPVKYSNGQLSSFGKNGDQISPYVQLNEMGYKQNRRLNTDLSVSIDQNLDFITKGLKVRGMFSYSGQSEHNTTHFKMPDVYIAKGRYGDGSLHTERTIEKRDESYGQQVIFNRDYYWELNSSYNRKFGDHSLGALMMFYLQSKSFSFKDGKNVESVIGSIPYRNEALSGRVTYGYKDTYFTEFNLGYTGSEQFQTGHRFGWFPAISGGWIPTQYKWVQKNLTWLDYFKLRASYGLVGNDRIGGTRFPYITTITGAEAGWNRLYRSIREGQVGTDGLVWEKAKKLDIGIDAHLLKGMLEFTIDYFRDNRTGIFQQRATVPDEMGLESLPWANIGSMQSHGMDGNITFTKDWNHDWRTTIRGNFTYSRNKVTNWEQSDIRYPYQSYTGVPYGVQRGLIALGLFRDWDDVYSSPKQSYEAKVYPGDIKYKDVNNDGVINDDDIVPLSYSNTPEIQYGFAAEVKWKHLSVSALFEGTGHSTFFYGGTGFYPFAWEATGNLLTIAADQNNRWTPREFSGTASTENPDARFPRLTYGENRNNNRASTFWLANNRYLRFKNLTIRYSFIHPWLNKTLGISNIDASFIVNNICTWDNIKLWDPGQVASNGAAYPIQRTYTLQFNISF